MRRSKFSLSYKHLLSFNMGDLVPIGLLEVLPGDSIQHATSALVRLSPMLAPVMHKVDIKIHHWFVPHRLCWEGFEDFITGGPDGEDDTVAPTVTVDDNDIAVGDLLDHLGVRPLTAGTFSAIPLRAYGLVFNEYYRDQDLDTPLTVSIASGSDTTTNRNMQRIRWSKDYFTSSRPWEQKGPDITLPLGTSAPVTGSAYVKGLASRGTPTWDIVSGNVTEAGGSVISASNSDGNRWASLDPGTGMTAAVRQIGSSVRPGVYVDTNEIGTGATPWTADLSSASAITVRALREALALQRFQEARARYGSRYPEYLRYLGVSPQDARLQRPEYLGGGRAPVQISEVLQTAEGTNPVGEMRGHGIGGMRSNRYRRFIPEHGYVLSLAAIEPKAIYADGLERHWSRTTREDYWMKELEFIGQQEVLNKEVYFAHATPNGVFGFQDRYREYREKFSRISGEFRTVLDHWHFARLFSSDPALNSTFVACIPAQDRVFAVPSQNVVYAMVRHSIQARRLVSASAAPRTF